MVKNKKLKFVKVKSHKRKVNKKKKTVKRVVKRVVKQIKDKPIEPKLESKVVPKVEPKLESKVVSKIQAKVEKKGFFQRLKTGFVNNKYKIASGLLAVAATGGIAYKIKHDRDKLKQDLKKVELDKNKIKFDLSVAESQKRISGIENKNLQNRLKNVPLPPTLDTESLKKFFNDSQKNLEILKTEKENLYKKYESEVNKFTTKVAQLKTTEEQFKISINNNNKIEANKANDEFVKITKDLEAMKENNQTLQKTLNETNVLLNSQTNILQQKINEAAKILENQNISDIQKEKDLKQLTNEKDILKKTSDFDKVENQAREKILQENARKLEEEIKKLKQTHDQEMANLTQENKYLKTELETKTTEITQLEAKLTKNVTDLNTELSNFKKTKEELERLKLEHSKNKAQIENLTKILEEQKESLTKKFGEIETVLTLINQKDIPKIILALETEIQTNEVEIKKFNDTKSALKQTLEMANNKLKEQKTALIAEQKKIAELEKTAAELEKRIAADVLRNKKKAATIIARFKDRVARKKAQEAEAARPIDISKLTSIEQKPLYITDIIDEIGKENGNDVKKIWLDIGLNLYNCLAFYRTQTQSIHLDILHETVKNIIKEEIEGLSTLINSLGKDNVISDFKSQVFYINSIDRSVRNHNNICILINKWITIKDSLFPVRIVMNFGLVAPNSPMENPAQVANDNYKKSVIQPHSFKNLINKINEGPFFTVTNTSSDAYNIQEDITGMFVEKKHLVYSAYGFSGSGKTYTLIDKANPNNVLTRVINSLNDKNDKNGITLNYKIYDYYGEIGDDLCVNITGVTSNDITATYQGPQKTSVNLTNAFDQITTAINSFNEQRKKNTSKSGRSIYRVRFTPNNPESSRSFLFIDIDIMQNGNPVGKVTILDMAGSENVETIQNSYFESVQTNYDLLSFNTSIDKIIKALDNTKPDNEGLVQIIKGLINSAKERSALLNALDKKTAYKTLREANIGNITANNPNTPGNFIKKQAWLALADNLKDGDMKIFANNYNNYNYFTLLSSMYSLKNTLYTIFGNNLTTDGGLPTIVNLKKINTIFDNIGLTPLSKNGIDITKFITDKMNQDAKMLINMVRSVSAPVITGLLQKVIDKIVDTIENANNGAYYRLLQKYKTDNNITITPSMLGKNYSSDITNWNKDYLYNIHCSLRFQGNFINEKLAEMKAYVSNLQNHKPDTTNFPGNILLSNGFSGNVKLILFTNIRLDFNPIDESGIKQGSIEQNKNIREAYRSSIGFANSINPLIKGRSNFGKKKYLSFGKIHTKHKVKKVKSGKNGKKSYKILKQHLKLLKNM